MRQGYASRDSNDGRKVEPNIRVVSVPAVSQIGSEMGNHVTDVGTSLPRGSISRTLYPGKVGFEAPPNAGRDVHNGGSQGRR